jgi:MFS family permease
MGLSEACYLPTALALISDYHRGPTRSLATGIHQSGYVLGVGLSGVGGWLAERQSWHYAFSLVGLASLAYCALIAFLLRDAPREGPSGTASAEAEPKVRVGEALVSLFARGSYFLALIGSALAGAILWTVSSWIPVFLQEHFHLTQGVAGLSATGYMSAAAVPGLLIGGVWADRWSRTNRRARMFVPAIGFLVVSLGILLTANADAFFLAVLGLVIYRLFLAFSDANWMPMLCEVVDRRYRATGYGVLNMMAAVAAGLGIYLSGVLRDMQIDLHIAFDFIAAASVTCALMFYLIKPKRQ